MNCKEMLDSMGTATDVIKESKLRETRSYVVIVLLSVIIILMGSYIMYDRYLDSKFDIEATTTEVTQDGEGYNSYIHGMGDIINGTESQNNDN